MEGFPDIGGGSSGGSSSAVAASFLQLPLPTAASSAPELVPRAGEHSGGSPLSLYRLLAGPSSSPLRGHHDEGVVLVRGEIPPAPADAETIKAKIMSHPLYSPLLASYLDCQKVGAPPDVLNRLLAVEAKLQDASPAAQGRRQHEPPRADPELDQFMVAYCNMLVKYREEMARPIHEATEFFKSVEMRLDSITDSTNCDRPGSSEDEQDTSCPEEMDPCAGAGEDKWLKDKDLKQQLLRKYGGGCMGSLRQGFCKRRKKGKLPKESRQKLLQWWELHDKWPYPSEAEKMALVESTGLDLRQINNWFINQRKRHWKPPASAEDMAFSVMDGVLFHGAPQATAAALFMADGMFRPLGSS